MATAPRRILTRKRLTVTLALAVIVGMAVAACGGSTTESAPLEPTAASAPEPRVSDPVAAAPEPAPPVPAPAQPEPSPEPVPEPEPVEPPPSPAQTVASADGLSTLDVLEGAMADPGMEISARALGAGELPPELAGFQLKGTIHELEPDGATFEEPVTVTRRVDTEALGIDPEDGVPVVTLISLSSDGAWEVLADQSITLDGTTAIVSGTTMHFTTVVAFSGVATVSMRPDNVKRKVKRSWVSEVWVLATQEATEEFAPTITSVAVDVGSLDILTPGLSRGVSGKSVFAVRSGS